MGLKAYSVIRVIYKLYAVNKNGNTGREQLIRSHSSARFCFKLSVEIIHSNFELSGTSN